MMAAGRRADGRRQGSRNRPDRRRPRRCRSPITTRSAPRIGAAAPHDASLLWIWRHCRARHGRRRRRRAERRSPASRSTPARSQPGDVFVALKDAARRPRLRVAGVRAPAPPPRSSRPATSGGAGDGALFRVDDTLRALERIGVAAAPACRRTRASSPSPAASARPAPRRCCGSAWRGSARRTPRRNRSTTTGACR